MVMTRAQLALVFSCTRAIADEEVDDHRLVDIGGRQLVDIGGHKMVTIQLADIGGHQLGQVVGEKKRRVDVT